MIFVGAVCHINGFRYVLQKVNVNYFQNVAYMEKFVTSMLVVLEWPPKSQKL